MNSRSVGAWYSDAEIGDPVFKMDHLSVGFFPEECIVVRSPVRIGVYPGSPKGPRQERGARFRALETRATPARVARAPIPQPAKNFFPPNMSKRVHCSYRHSLGRT